VRLLVATRSADKLREIHGILRDVDDLRVLDLNDLGIEETPEEETIERYESFEENAVAKARYFGDRSGLPTVADDSGLAVDALGGRPGVRSKRFAPGGETLTGKERDEANNLHLLDLLRDVELPERTARYVCVAALVEAGGETRTFRGEAEGLILGRPRGWQGFGYDPLFLDRSLGLTFAEISREEKAERSHRGKAFRALAEFLRQRLGTRESG
jgi:XTP/dITP diphosphohydrolase